MMSVPKSAAVLVLLVAANLVAGMVALTRYAQLSGVETEVVRLPPHLAVVSDESGASSSRIHATLVSFVRPTDATAIKELEAVMDQTIENLRIFLVTDAPTNLLADLSRRGAEILPVASRQEWRELVSVTGDLTTWAVYDQRGLQRSTGNFAQGGLRGALGTVLETAPYYSVALLGSRLAPHFRDDGLGFRGGHAPSESRAVFFLGELATGCPVERALRTVDQAGSLARESSIEVLVPPQWLDYEIETLRANLSLSIPVRRAPEAIANEWEEMRSTYGSAATAGFFIQFRPGHRPTVLIETDPIVRFLESEAPGG